MPAWLDQQKLQSLGFDCSVNPTRGAASRFYQRRRPRQAFVALEYDGAAWRAWFETYRREAEQRAKTGSIEQNYIPSQSHLVAIDSDLHTGTLRGRYPDRSNVLIVPAIVAISLTPYPYPGSKFDPNKAARIEGRIQQLASSIHVPRPFSDGFEQ